MEEAMESAGRKFKRVLTFKKSVGAQVKDLEDKVQVADRARNKLRLQRQITAALDARADITSYLEKVATALSDKNIHAEWQICSGNPVEEIARHALEAEADLIMMSTHGKGGNGTGEMGSVTMAVVSSGETPVMVIKPPEKIASR